jgi:hypothetical protein
VDSHFSEALPLRGSAYKRMLDIFAKNNAMNQIDVLLDYMKKLNVNLDGDSIKLVPVEFKFCTLE